MSHTLLLSRRAALHIAAVLPAAILFGHCVLDFRPRTEVVKKIAGFYAHKKDAAIVGAEYLNSVPTDADAQKLIALIVPSGSDRFRRLSDAYSEEVHGIIVGWLREDFELGRVVKVSGWLLSETEARLCALTALTIIRS